MVDNREAILVRLCAIAKDIRGIKSVARNRDAIGEDERPAIQILDADESADDNDPVGSRPVGAPRRISMNPEIYIMLGAGAEDVGTELNRFRAAFLKALFADEKMIALVLDREGIRYEASATGLARGRKMEGTIGLSVTFTYLFRPSEL